MAKIASTVRIASPLEAACDAALLMKGVPFIENGSPDVDGCAVFDTVDDVVMVVIVVGGKVEALGASAEVVLLISGFVTVLAGDTVLVVLVVFAFVVVWVAPGVRLAKLATTFEVVPGPVAVQLEPALMPAFQTSTPVVPVRPEYCQKRPQHKFTAAVLALQCVPARP